MICPLLAIAIPGDLKPAHRVQIVCAKQGCAFWHKQNNRCSIVTLAQGSTYIHKVLLEIASKMPREK